MGTFFVSVRSWCWVIYLMYGYIDYGYTGGLYAWWICGYNRAITTKNSET